MKTGIEGNGNLIKMICSGGDKLLVRKVLMRYASLNPQMFMKK